MLPHVNCFIKRINDIIEVNVKLTSTALPTSEPSKAAA
jgi:hypothetical protein